MPYFTLQSRKYYGIHSLWWRSNAIDIYAFRPYQCQTGNITSWCTGRGYTTKIIRILKTQYWQGKITPPLPVFEIYTSSICRLQFRQAILTVFVARTEFPQQGHTYFLVLDVRGVTVPAVPLCAPVPVMRKPLHSLRFSKISVRPLFRTNSSKSSLGVVQDHPYLSLCSTQRPWRSAHALNRRLW